MIDHITRITGLVKDELHKLTLGKETVGFAVGHVFATVPLDPNSGRMYVGPLWVLLVTMRDPRLGYPDIAQSLPVFGALPPDSLFREIVATLLGACRKEHDEALKVDA